MDKINYFLSKLRRLRVKAGSIVYNFFKLRKYKITKNDVVIDCGANMGDFSSYFLRKGAKVYAFEPDPVIYKILSERFATNNMFTSFRKGVWIKKDKLKFYLPSNLDEDRLNNSVGNSLFADKNDISKKYLIVEVIDLINFIKNLNNKRIRLLKLDIEGAEIPVLKKIISSSIYKKIDYIIVETHEEVIESTKKELSNIKALIKKKDIKNIDLNWH
jgi:FkbM family methyltransferase